MKNRTTLEHISDDDTAILVVGPAENDPSKIVFRIDDAKTGEQFAYVKLGRNSAKTITKHLMDLLWDQSDE